MEKNVNSATNEKKRMISRLFSIGIFASLLLMFLFVRVVYIKVAFGHEYERVAIEQGSRGGSSAKEILATRGDIFDRNKESLAISYGVDNIILDVSEMVKERNGKENQKALVEKTIENISLYLKIPKEKINEFLKTDEKGNPIKDTKYLVIAKNVERKTSKMLLDSEVICIYAEPTSKRQYVHENLASQVLGFVRGDTMLGLESQYDETLSGVNGKYFRQDGASSFDAVKKESAIDGYSLVTTIDMNVQKIAEQAVFASNLKYPAKSTAAIILDPNTGEVLAMAQYPKFSNNDPANIEKIGEPTDQRYKSTLSALSEADKINQLNEIWKNFFVSSSFEPGSIYKPFVVAAALEEGAIGLNETFTCDKGYAVVNGKEIECNDRIAHGTQTITEVLANSCNVSMMKIMEKLGAKNYIKYHQDFGYGEKTGVDLPGESGFSNVQYSLAQLGNVSYRATSSFGQGFNVTAIQSINSFASLINGGKLLKPYVVAQVIDRSGNIIKDNRQTTVKKVISKETSDFMRNALVSVITQKGTGRKAVINGYRIGGKTGTAQQGVRHEDKELDEYTLSFISYFPADDPKYIVMSIIDRPTDYIKGETSPAPMLKEIMTNIIKLKNLQPTTTGLQEAEIEIEDESITVENYVGGSVVDATKDLNRLGINFEISSSGSVVSSQTPTPKIKTNKDATVFLYLKRQGTEKLSLVPNVVGMEAGRAVEILKSAGLTVFANEEVAISESEQTLQASPENQDNQQQSAEGTPQEILTDKTKIVTSQMPTAGVEVGAGTEVRLNFNKSE